MKMKDLEKLRKEADKIIKRRKNKMPLLKKASEEGLIKKPIHKFNPLKCFLWNCEEICLCPECKHELNVVLNYSGFHYTCPRCDYEYAY